MEHRDFSLGDLSLTFFYSFAATLFSSTFFGSETYWTTCFGTSISSGTVKGYLLANSIDAV
jgi:hypothetical protein